MGGRRLYYGIDWVLLLSLFVPSFIVVIKFALEFGRKHGTVLYGFIPPLLVIYTLYLLPAFTIVDFIRTQVDTAKIQWEYNPTSLTLFLLAAGGNWLLTGDYSITFTLAVLSIVYGIRPFIRPFIRYLKVAYPILVDFNAVIILRDTPHLLLLCLVFSGIYFLNLYRIKNYHYLIKTSMKE